MSLYQDMRRNGYTGKPKYYKMWLKEQRQMKMRAPLIKKFSALISGQILMFNSDDENNKNIRSKIMSYMMSIMSLDNDVEDMIEIEVRNIIRQRDVSKFHYVSEFF